VKRNLDRSFLLLYKSLAVEGRFGTSRLWRCGPASLVILRKR